MEISQSMKEIIGLEHHRLPASVGALVQFGIGKYCLKHQDPHYRPNISEVVNINDLLW